MKYYCVYMDSIQFSEEQKKKLTEQVKRRMVSGRTHTLRRLVPLAACLAVVAAVGGLVWPVLPLHEAAPDVVDSGEAPQADADPVQPQQQEEPQQDAQSGVAYNWPNVAVVEFTEETQGETLTADIAPPAGWFAEDLTDAQIAEMLGCGEKLSWLLGWDGYDVAGRVIYGGDGSVFQVIVWGNCADGVSFTMELAPDALPPTCIVTNDDCLTEVGGVETEASYQCYDRDGDDTDEYVYKFSMLPSDVGVRFEAVGEDQNRTQTLALLAANWCALWTTDGLTLEHLIPESIPEWRDDRLDSEESARAEDLGEYLPQNIPQGFAFESGWRELGQGRDSLGALWSNGMREVYVTVSRPEQKPRLMDASKPELYDVRLYEIPWGETVPEDVREAGFFDPVFAQKDLTEDVVSARLYEADDTGDVSGLRMCFGVWNDDAGVLIEYDAKGLTAQQARELVLDN